MNKEQIQDLNSRLLGVKAQFDNLSNKIDALFSLLYKTEPPTEKYNISRHVYDPEIYREVVKLSELFCKKYGNLIPKDEV